MTSQADQVYIAERGGLVFRYDAREPSKATVAERIRLAPEGVGLTILGFLVGEQSIVAGGSDGSVNVFFRLRSAGAKTTDGFTIEGHELEPQPASVIRLRCERTQQNVCYGRCAGNIWVRHSTSEQTFLKLPTSNGGKISAVSFSPRENAVVAMAGDKTIWTWRIDVPHPETTFSSIFGKVWYEDYPEPAYTWQSSSGTDAFEPKFSLVPLDLRNYQSRFLFPSVRDSDRSLRGDLHFRVSWSQRSRAWSSPRWR